MKTNILGTSAGPTHRQMEETIRGVIEATVIRENNPRCQLNVTIQPFNTNFCLTPLINCTILGPLLIRTGRTGPPGAVRWVDGPTCCPDGRDGNRESVIGCRCAAEFYCICWNCMSCRRWRWKNKNYSKSNLGWTWIIDCFCPSCFQQKVSTNSDV